MWVLEKIIAVKSNIFTHICSRIEYQPNFQNNWPAKDFLKNGQADIDNTLF